MLTVLVEIPFLLQQNLRCLLQTFVLNLHFPKHFGKWIQRYPESAAWIDLETQCVVGLLAVFEVASPARSRLIGFPLILSELTKIS